MITGGGLRFCFSSEVKECALRAVHVGVFVFLCILIAWLEWQGPRLVTLEGYREQAEELLVAIADLTYPRVSDGWLDKLSQKVSHFSRVTMRTVPGTRYLVHIYIHVVMV